MAQLAYDELREQDIPDLMEELGRDVIFRKISFADVDPSDITAPEVEVAVDTPTKVVEVSGEADRMFGGNVNKKDLEFLLPADEITQVDVGDFIVDGAGVFCITKVTTIRPGVDNLLFWVEAEV